MGGTSTDVALVQDLTPRIGRETKVGDLTVRASSVDVRTVGAGGGSIAHVPELTKALRVGPAVGRRRARARPRTAWAAATRPSPTPTSSSATCRPRWPAARSPWTSTASRAAVQKIADAMGLPSAEAAAAGIIDIVNENMLGGAAPGQRPAGLRPARLRAGRLRRRRPAARQRAGQADRRLAGDRAAVARRAVRAGRRDHVSLRDESARTCLRRFADLTGAELARHPRRAGRRRRGRGWSTQGLPRGRAARSTTRSTSATSGRASRSRSASTRPGSTTWTACWPARRRPSTPSTSGCSPSCSSTDHELVNARASVSGPRPGGRRRCRWSEGDGDPSAAQAGTHPVYVERRRHRRGRSTTAARLRAGDVVTGPAIVVEMDSTTLVLPGHARHACIGQPADPLAHHRPSEG